MEIILGRDSQTRRLSIIKDGETKYYGQTNSVPMDVSRHHLSLELIGEGKWKIKNLNARNVTYVNGIAVETKTISEKDNIELGNSRYLLNWDSIRGSKEETIDIRPLNIVWDEYNNTNIEIRKRQKTIGLLASIPIGITMLGGLLSGIASDNLKPYAYVFTAIALVVMLYGFYRRFTDNSIEEQEDIKKTFQRKYVCPKCGHFMGFQDYDILAQSDGCPYCKTKYKK